MTGANRRSWLILVYQFPEGPGALRVKIWRRLQRIGAVAVKNSMYVLPESEQSQEDFAWVLGELIAGGAEGAILESRFLHGLDDSQVRELFNTARDADYQSLAQDIEGFLTDASNDPGPEGQRLLTRSRKRLSEIEANDFFGALHHAEAEAALRALSDRLTKGQPEGGLAMANEELNDLTDRTWVTRRNVRVDRIASAWLIRKWIDPRARFKFVDSRGYRPQAQEIRFDMFEAEFTHIGDRCTFEVLAGLARPDDAGLKAVGEIVHDIDLKDGRYGRPEAQGIAALLDGLATSVDEDRERIERGGQIFESLYRSFSGSKT